MPFADVTRPALGVSLLKAAAVRAGHPTRVEYCNIDLAELVGTEFYARLADDFPADILVGEWFFSRAAFGDAVSPDDDYIDAFLSSYLSRAAIDDILRTRRQLDGYLAACVERIMATRPRVVGFTTTFHQTSASVAVAQRLKRLDDPPIVVFGGANCEGEMGEQLLASFECIDVVSRGEADETFVELLDHLLRGGPVPAKGILRRGGPPTESCSVERLDGLPVPDFDEYFARLAALAEPPPRQLVLETARGCWWGQRRHCTFCGLNGQTMGFRSKSPERALAEIRDTCTRYDTPAISFADNILDPAYVDSLFPALAADERELDLFFEVKANLRRDELETLRAGGVRQIQPGVESLSDDILRLMRKGTTAFQNVQLLRWAGEVDIGCSWNIICGFPGEPPAAYATMAALIPSLVHLMPPGSSARVRLDRFSPFHAAPQESGFTRVRPARAYFYVYPFARRELFRLAYFFDYDYGDGRDVDAYFEPVAAAVRRWWERWNDRECPPRLDAHVCGDAIVITDTRDAGEEVEHVVRGLAATVLAACDRTTSTTQLRLLLGTVDVADLDAVIDSLVADRLVARNGGQLVALPLFRDRPADHPYLRIRRNEPSHAETVAVPALLRLGRSA